jgi:hypothetical protein
MEHKLTSRGLKPNCMPLDNDASKLLKDYLHDQDINFQLVPPYCHRRNATECAIPSFKDHVIVKLLPLPQPPVRARTDTRTNSSAQRATQLRSVLARVYAVSIQNQITTTVP